MRKRAPSCRNPTNVHAISASASSAKSPKSQRRRHAVDGVGLVEGLQGTGHSPNGEWRKLLEQQLMKNPRRQGGRTRPSLATGTRPRHARQSQQCCRHRHRLPSRPGSRKGERFDLHVKLPYESKATASRAAISNSARCVSGSRPAISRTIRSTKTPGNYCPATSSLTPKGRSSSASAPTRTSTNSRMLASGKAARRVSIGPTSS